MGLRNGLAQRINHHNLICHTEFSSGGHDSMAVNLAFFVGYTMA